MEDLNHLFGTCACERNQYTVVIPTSSAALAEVIFDNSAANRRSQASPVTAWLRVPLDWHHSSTFAHFPDETHATIKRTFSTPPSPSSPSSRDQALPPTRRQFCGYCGTHLTAWNEGLHGQGRDSRGAYIDITLGSLLSESLERLESLRLYGDSEDDEESERGNGLVKGEGAQVDNDTHIPTTEGNTAGTGVASASSGTPTQRVPQHRMTGRGIPYFEEMVENSRLGRIKRQKGGQTSADGTRRVQWEVVEIEEGDGDGVDTAEQAGIGVNGGGSGGNKRMRMDI